MYCCNTTPRHKASEMWMMLDRNKLKHRRVFQTASYSKSLEGIESVMLSLLGTSFQRSIGFARLCLDNMSLGHKLSGPLNLLGKNCLECKWLECRYSDNKTQPSTWFALSMKLGSSCLHHRLLHLQSPYLDRNFQLDSQCRQCCPLQYRKLRRIGQWRRCRKKSRILH